MPVCNECGWLPRFANGTDIDATQEEKYLAFLQLAEGTLSEEALAEWIRSHLQAPSTDG